MKKIEEKSKYIAFFDECGDHSLEAIDRDFPLFLLSTVIVKREEYVSQVIPELNRLKLAYWNHEGINFHSREIRKAQGVFSILQVPIIRNEFTFKLSKLMIDLPYFLFITAVHKNRLKNRYGLNAQNPYDLSLKFTLERIAHFIKTNNVTILPFIAEARGKKEDSDLERVFYRIMKQGTYYHPPSEFAHLNISLEFRKKFENIAGIQLADLCGYPYARHILKPDQENRAFDIVKTKVYHEGGISGCKIFP